MFARAIFALLLLWTGSASAAEVIDATGRTVQVPDHIAHVLPAGPEAAVLLAALAPDLMLGWPQPVPADAKAMLGTAAANAPQIPLLTGGENVLDKVKALKPDLIVDYGTVSPQYADLAKTVQQKTGIPTLLLDGSLLQIPHVLRMLGSLLHREERGETLARFAEAMLSMPLPAGTPPKIVFVHGTKDLSVAAPGTDDTEVFTRLGWNVLAPPGKGAFRSATVQAIRALDPDILIFADPSMAAVIAHDPAWQAVRAVHDHQAFVAPSLPFGWIDGPPSINRLLGVAWLAGSDPGTIAALSNAVIYGHVLGPLQYNAVLAGFRPQ